jgi:hypothetical protein
MTSLVCRKQRGVATACTRRRGGMAGTPHEIDRFQVKSDRMIGDVVLEPLAQRLRQWWALRAEGPVWRWFPVNHPQRRSVNRADAKMRNPFASQSAEGAELGS